MIDDKMDISVVIPLYNKRDTIERAIDSILAQTYQPHEIIVVNDGSTDGSEKIVEQLHYPQIKLIHQENAGVSSARNRGIKEAQYDWVAFLDADDIWYHHYLKTIKRLKVLYSEANVLATSYILQSYTGERQKLILNLLPFEGNHGILSNYFEVASRSHPPLWTSAVVVAKKSLLEIEGFPLHVKSGEDLITWARLAVRNTIAYSLNPGAAFIQDPAHTYDDQPNRIPEKTDVVGENLLLLHKNYSKVPGLKKYIAHWFKMRGSVYLRLGDKSGAFEEIKKSLLYDPSQYRVYIYLLLIALPVSWTLYLFKKLA